MSKILTKPAEIRQWAEARSGSPVLMETPSGTKTRTVLQLTFGQQSIDALANQGERAGGFELVSWEDWLAALEREGLALRVSDDPSGGAEAEYDFVPRPAS